MAWRKAVTCIFSLPKALRSLATPEFSWVHCYFLSSVSCKTPCSCSLSGVCCIFSDVWPYSGVNLPGLVLWYVGRRQVWGAGEAVLLELPNPAQESSCASSHAGSPPLFKGGAGACIGQCKSDFSLSPKHESASPSLISDGWKTSDSHQIASAVLTSVPVPQPEAPCGQHLAPG